MHAAVRVIFLAFFRWFSHRGECDPEVNYPNTNGARTPRLECQARDSGMHCRRVRQKVVDWSSSQGSHLCLAALPSLGGVTVSCVHRLN
jgi:hypothetical protein